MTHAFLAPRISTLLFFSPNSVPSFFWLMAVTMAAGSSPIVSTRWFSRFNCGDKVGGW